MKLYKIYKNEDETIISPELLAKAEEAKEKGLDVITVEDLREVLEKEKEAAEKLKEVRKETHGGGVLLLDLAIQADIDRCNGEIQLAKKLLYMLEEKEARK